jgi:glycosyltransferase involved in cell wall biosynthesis
MEIKSKTLLSIICRSYNGEKYIFEALKSLANCLNEQCEVIIVDNGSTDKTISIVKEFLDNKKYNIKFKLIEQTNSGPGGSLNTGIDNATGKYIGFLDCDDMYFDIFKSKILNILNNQQIDILEYGFLVFSDPNKIYKKNFKSLYKNLNGKYLIKDILEVIFARTNWYPFTRIFRRDLWEKIRFPINKAYEDDMTLYKVFLKSNSIYILDEPAIAYRNHLSSITATHTNKQLFDLIKFYWDLDIDDLYKNIFRIRLARAISHFSIELKQGKDEYKKILNNQKEIKLPLKKTFYLKKTDIFYYFFPYIYDFINFIRLRLFR